MAPAPEVWVQNLAGRASDTKRREDPVETDADVSKYKDQMTDTQGAGPAFSPIKVFLALVAVIAVIVGIILATDGDDETQFTLPQETPLTEQQASEELRELVDRANQVFRNRDLRQLRSIYTSTSPVLSIASDEINQMLDDNVVNRSSYESLEITLVSSTPQELVLRERTRISTLFVTEDGKDVTRDEGKIIQTVLWTLRKEDGVWQIHDSVIEASEPIGATK